MNCQSFLLSILLLSFNFLTQQIQAFAYDALQFQLRRIDKFTQSEVLGSHFIDTQCLHPLYVTCQDRLDEELRQDIHRQHTVVFTGHDHVAFASFHTGIQCIFALTAEQPAEVGTACAEVIQTGADPAEEFINITSFGNDSHLRRVRTQESIGCCRMSRQHVSINDTNHTVSQDNTAFQQRGQLCTHFHTDVRRSRYLRTGQDNRTGQVHMSGPQGTSDENHIFRSQRPHLFAFVDRVHMVNLYTDIACGVNAGVDTAFVLSGEGTLADLAASDVKPTWVFDDIAALHRALREEENHGQHH